MSPYEVKLVKKKGGGREKRLSEFDEAMALWREWMREKKAGDRITVRDVATNEYKVIEHG